ncbi:MAG: lipopolysaccharide biosynthesis protein [Bacteroidales bacterium]
MSVSFKKSLFKNLLTLGGYNYSSQIANFLASIILSRLLLPEEYGFVALITVFTGFIVMFADAGLSYAIIRSDYGHTFYRAMTNLSFYIGLVLFLLMCLMAYPIAWFYGDPALVVPTLVMSLTFVIGAFKITPMAVFSKQLDFNFVGKVRLISNLTSIAFMILLAWLGFSFWSLIIPQLLLHLVQYILFEIKLRLGFRFYPFRYTRVAFRKTRSLITNVSGFNLINYWARNADNLIIGKYYSSAELGIYNRGYKMLQLSLNLISGLFGTVLYPSLKKYRDEGGDIRSEYANVLGIISLLNFPIGLVLILFPVPFVEILWGENWLEVAGLLPYFGLLIFFQTMISTTGHLYILLEHERRFMIVGAVSAVLMVAAIIGGALFSMMMVVISYTACFLLVIVPFQLWIGFMKTFGFNFRYIINFWIPKLVIGLALMVVIYLDLFVWQAALLGVYLLHLLYYQRHDLNRLQILIINKVREMSPRIPDENVKGEL